MFLIINFIIILLIIRILFNGKILKSLMEYRWKFLLSFQHIFFLFIFILITYFTENYFLDAAELVWSIILNTFFNIGIYYLVYYYLVPHFYLSNKYPEFILYALICFLVSSLFRILWEPAVFTMDFSREGYHVGFLYNVYISQGIVILVASFLGITKDKFLIEQNVIDLGEEKEQLYLDLLKSKLNPHFLLNTLNNMYANSFTHSEKTPDSILQLSKLLQYIIYDSGKEKISVSQEFSSLKALAALYQLKYNNRLDIMLDIKDLDEFDIVEIPPSLLFTLFENALKHSAIGEEEHSFIRLYCGMERSVLYFKIINTVGKYRTEPVETGYQGLGNEAVVHILNKFYVNQYEFYSGPEDDDRYKIVLKINING
ncbi:histidine kinase [Chryseobacterium sp.]|uniref:sensor histidine kinase n=1 Tax=Chryseobacterium sp. TaxID=1871047 RepID=UPI0025B8DB26|nr:histidine kinase [Chryseobacterium sp.]MBV8327990.1 histidine kinase [Chryseobacterium sp.]